MASSSEAAEDTFSVPAGATACPRLTWAQLWVLSSRTHRVLLRVLPGRSDNWLHLTNVETEAQVTLSGSLWSHLSETHPGISCHPRTHEELRGTRRARKGREPGSVGGRALGDRSCLPQYRRGRAASRETWACHVQLRAEIPSPRRPATYQSMGSRWALPSWQMQPLRAHVALSKASMAHPAASQPILSPPIHWSTGPSVHPSTCLPIRVALAKPGDSGRQRHWSGSRGLPNMAPHSAAL